MSLAGSKALSHHGPSASAAARSSAGSEHHSHRGRASQVSRLEAAGPATRSAAQSEARSNSHNSHFARPENIPPPPESVVSFAARSVDPSDSVSQIGSHRSSSRNRSLSRKRSRSTNARSQASSTRLTAANLHAHDAEPAAEFGAAERSQHASQSHVEHSTRGSQHGLHEAAGEESGSHISAHQSRPMTPASRASTAKPSPRDGGSASQAMSRVDSAGPSRAGSKVATPTPSHSGSRASHAHSSHHGSHVSVSHGSHVSSKVHSVLLSQSGSSAHHSEHAHSAVNTGSNAGSGSQVSRASKSVHSQHGSHASQEPHPLAESAIADEVAAIELHSGPPSRFNGIAEGSKVGSSTPRSVARSVASREPSLRLPESNLQLPRESSEVDVVEVEREDEQFNEVQYRIQRRHQYLVRH